jgi:hypothetical protein
MRDDQLLGLHLGKCRRLAEGQDAGEAARTLKHATARGDEFRGHAATSRIVSLPL